MKQSNEPETTSWANEILGQIASSLKGVMTDLKSLVSQTKNLKS
jgi:hypothetical protein